MNKIFKELLNRRIPHIMGSYIVAGTSLVVFIDWLASRYSFPQEYVSIALFCIISILPSVFILAYFHGAPGKDEWTKVEKYAIPINIIFIACVIFMYKGFFKQEVTDTVFDNIYYYIDSRQDLIDMQMGTIFNQQDLLDNGVESITSVSDKFLDEIYIEVPPRVNSKLAHQNVVPYYPQNKKDLLRFNIFPDPEYFWTREVDGADSLYVSNLKNKIKNLDNELDNENNVNIDGYLSLHLYRLKFLDGRYGMIYTLSFWSIHEDDMKMGARDEGYIDFEDDPEDNIKDELVEEIVDIILDKRFGGLVVGKVDDILSDDIISIKIDNKNLTLLEGNLLKGYRNYWYYHDWVDIEDEYKKQLDDFQREANYIKNNPLYIIETECEGCALFDLTDGEHNPKNIQYILSDYLENSEYGINPEIDSLKIGKTTLWDNELKRTSTVQIDKHYILEIIKVTETHVTAKVLEKNAPFVIPKVFDKTYLIIE